MQLELSFSASSASSARGTTVPFSRPHFEDTYEQRCEPSIGSLPIVVEISSQAIFTLEAVMKLLAFHMKYFEDPWNKLDFFSKHIPTPKP